RAAGVPTRSFCEGHEAAHEVIPPAGTQLVAVARRNEAHVPEPDHGRRARTVAIGEVEPDAGADPLGELGRLGAAPNHERRRLHVLDRHGHVIVVESEGHLATLARIAAHVGDPQPPSPSSVWRAANPPARGASATVSTAIPSPSSPPASSSVLRAPTTRGHPPLTISSTVLPGSKPSWITVSFTTSHSGSSVNVTRDRGSAAMRARRSSSTFIASAHSRV